MSRYEKVLQSKANSRHFLKDSHNYSGVDGRVYKTEIQPVAPTTTISSEELYHLQQRQNMSLGELYQMERFLTDGTRNKKLTPSAKERDRILEEYPIEKDHKTRTFKGDLDAIWGILKEKFPETSAPFKGYKACQYAVRYGAIEQVAWKPAVEKNTEKQAPKISKDTEPIH